MGLFWMKVISSRWVLLQLQLEDATFCLKVFVSATPGGPSELPSALCLSVYFLLCILSRSPRNFFPSYHNKPYISYDLHPVTCATSAFCSGQVSVCFREPLWWERNWLQRKEEAGCLGPSSVPTSEWHSCPRTAPNQMWVPLNSCKSLERNKKWGILKQDPLLMQDNADPVLLGDHDVALASIEKVVVGE